MRGIALKLVAAVVLALLVYSIPSLLFPLEAHVKAPTAKPKALAGAESGRAAEAEKEVPLELTPREEVTGFLLSLAASLALALIVALTALRTRQR